MTRRRAKHRSTVSPARVAPQREIQPWQCFLLAAAAPLAICASKLNLDLWYDEIYTLNAFVSGGPAKIVTDYSVPNNHVLYSLLLWPVHLISTSSFVLRLPSFVLAAATLWLAFQLARRFGGLAAGVLTIVLLGLNQMFLIYAMQVRGYGLSMFLFTWLFSLALPRDVATRPWRLAAIALVGAAFLYVMPTNLLLLAPLAAINLTWVIWPPADEEDTRAPAAPERGSIAGRLALCGGAWVGALLLAAACYAPIARQVLSHRGTPLAFSLSELLATTESFLKPALYDFLPLAPLFLLGLIVWGIRRARGRESESPALPAAAAACFCGAFLLTAALGIRPFPRNFCPLLPVVALAQAWTLTVLAKSFRWAGASAETKGTLAAALLIAVVATPRLWTYPERLADFCRRHPGEHDGYFNYYAADYRPSAVVESLRRRTADGRPFRVYFSEQDHINLTYYLELLGQPLAHGDAHGSDEPLATIYLIAPASPDWKSLSEKSHLSEKTLRAFPVLEDFGYYRLCGLPLSLAPLSDP